MSERKLVKDYKGNLVPKISARKITGKYYTENVSCYLMSDGQWYRVDSPKLAYDHYTKKHVLLSSAALLSGAINEKGDLGMFSPTADYVSLIERRGENGGSNKLAMNAQIAEKLGYEECIGDGAFYKKSNISAEDLAWFHRKDIPKNERSSDYNLETNPEKKLEMIECYEKSNFPISIAARRIARYVGDFTFGMETEIINGFMPKRIKAKYGLKALKDGSLRHGGAEGGGEGIEYVTMPMSGAKGIQTIIDVMKEFSKRCSINNWCSLHFHFGNVRRDKVYILSLYKLISMLQGELKSYFPYSRFNSIKTDGKVYCKLLENLSIDYKTVLNAKTEVDFKQAVVKEFGKIYMWLNGGKALAEEFAPPTVTRELVEVNGKKMFCDSWFKNLYTTKLITHAITGQKWDKPSRYYLINFLNLFFNNIGTIEFRCHESTTNPNKAIIWLLVCASILKYAENTKDVLGHDKITLTQVLATYLPQDMLVYIMEYFQFRNKTFFTQGGNYKEKWANIEANWFSQDPKFEFESKNKYKLI